VVRGAGYQPASGLLALWSGIYFDISHATAGNYEKYSPVVSFDLRCQSGVYNIATPVHIWRL